MSERGQKTFTTSFQTATRVGHSAACRHRNWLGPAPRRGGIEGMALETSPESPVPVRTVLQLVSGWIGRLGRVWVEGQIAECKKRGSTVFLTVRDPIAAVSAQVVCTRQLYEMASPQEG